MSKKNIVVFLGAGVSKALDYPLTKDILGLICQEIRLRTLFSDDVDKETAFLYQELLKKLLIDLSPGLSIVFEDKGQNSLDELPLITELLSQAEHLFNNDYALTDFNYDIDNALLRRINSLNEKWSLKDVITLLEWAIIKVINKQGKNSNKALEGFINWLINTNKREDTFISIITSNYDYSVEENLLPRIPMNQDIVESIDYGFNSRSVVTGDIKLTPKEPYFRVLKLHGSIDWLKCNRCGYIYINTAADIYELAFSHHKSDSNTCHCSFWPLEPVLITPSYSRTVKDSNLSQIWRNALEYLRIADEWIIAGYSLPGEDLDIRSLLIRALKGRTNPPKIKVIQQSERSKHKYNSFFGNGYEYILMPIEQFDFSKLS